MVAKKETAHVDSLEDSSRYAPSQQPGPGLGVKTYKRKTKVLNQPCLSPKMGILIKKIKVPGRRPLLLSTQKLITYSSYSSPQCSK